MKLYQSGNENTNNYEWKKKGEKSMNPKTTMTDSTMVFEGIRFVGDVEGSHDFFLLGEVEGTIDLTALMTIGRSGKFKGEIKAKRVIIEGDVEGKVSAEEKVELRDGGKLTGDIEAPSVLISDKAYFQGNVMMVNNKQQKKKTTVTNTEKADPWKNIATKVKIVDNLDVNTEKQDQDVKKNKTLLI